MRQPFFCLLPVLLDAAGYGRAATYNMEEQTCFEIDVRWFRQLNHYVFGKERLRSNERERNPGTAGQLMRGADKLEPPE